jgi:endonuclease YncB( thermonuclease family)
MKNFILFWKKDIINKLIIILSAVLAAGVLVFIFMLFNMPEGKSLSEAISEIIPIPATSDPDGNLTTTPAVTSTALPFNVSITQIPTEGAALIPTALPPVVLIPTLTPELFTSTPLASETPSVSLNNDCIPKNPPQIGKAVSVLDGNTINVLIDGLVYVVRYIGVDAPKDAVLAEKARLENAKLVFGKEISLISDQSDKDTRGRLLRYVLVGETFVNLDLIQRGFGSALDAQPDSACAQTFEQADQSASSTPIGLFGVTQTLTPTPTP